MIDDSPPSLPPFLPSLLSFGRGAGSVAWEPLVTAHANPVPTLTAEGWGKAWGGGSASGKTIFPPTPRWERAVSSSHPHHTPRHLCVQNFPSECLFPYQISARGVHLIVV